MEYIFPIPCDSDGNIIGDAKYPLNSNGGTNYNHKLLWAVLPKRVTHNQPFDYYPRGRVEIKNAKATVYLNPDVNTDKVQRLIISLFGLVKKNGINRVRFVSDGSVHYKYRT